MPVEIIDIETHLYGYTAAKLRLAKMEFNLEHMHDVVAGMLDDAAIQTEAQFSSEGVAAGTPWAPLEESTIRSKDREGDPFPEWPLVASGAMMASEVGFGPYTEQEIFDTQAYIGVDWEKEGYQIPALHQEGVAPELVHRRGYTRADGTQVAATSYMWHLPSRPTFLATEKLEDLGAARIEEHVMSPWP